MNLTYPTTLVLEAVARGHHHGFQMMDVTGLPSGTVYPLLRRLEREGLVTARWEKTAVARREQRPPRRYYQLTAAGEAMRVQALERFPVVELLLARDGKKLRAARSMT
ncbi:MAG TPA: PadR family transcriptional regulator [Vicinamibacteria bacterium]|nr:PadR family transcriptional regulator [Vicinamibacteria bacterium]